MARNYCFTSFKTEKKITFTDDMQYLVYQMEACPETKKHHWQGFVQVKKKCRLNTIKKIIGDDAAHIELTKGSSIQAADYCKKEESRVEGPYEFGEISYQGKRNDLKEACKLAKEGKWREIEGETYVKYSRGLKAYAALHTENKMRDVKVYIYWGKTGCGKSYKAFTENKDAYWKPPGPWWDGYSGEQTVIMDDFDPNDHKITDLLRWIDKYPILIPVKGSFCPLLAKKIVITSHFNPKYWYDRHEEVLRRCTEIVEMN